MNSPMDPATGVGMVVDLLLDDIQPAGFYLAAFHHSSPGAVLWWGPDGRGYTPDLETAGLYSYEQAKELDHGNGAIPVPAAMIDGLRVRRVVDPGDSLNAMFRSSKLLRAHLAATGRWIQPIRGNADDLLPRRLPTAWRDKMVGLLRELSDAGTLTPQQCAEKLSVDLATWLALKAAP